MGGINYKKEILNNTLLFIIKLLNKNNIDNWFIGYGTLLGIVRNNSCINGDDDIDIIIDKKYYDKIKTLLIENNFSIEYGFNINDSKDILKTKIKKNYCSIDFYMCTLDLSGNFIDNWEKVIWSNCFDVNNKLIEKIWKTEKIYLPFNYINKLVNRYGNNWKTPIKNYKGTYKNKIL